MTAKKSSGIPYTFKIIADFSGTQLKANAVVLASNCTAPYFPDPSPWGSYFLSATIPASGSLSGGNVYLKFRTTPFIDGSLCDIRKKT